MTDADADKTDDTPPQRRWGSRLVEAIGIFTICISAWTWIPDNTQVDVDLGVPVAELSLGGQLLWATPAATVTTAGILVILYLGRWAMGILLSADQNG